MRIEHCHHLEKFEGMGGEYSKISFLQVGLTIFGCIPCQRNNATIFIDVLKMPLAWAWFNSDLVTMLPVIFEKNLLCCFLNMRNSRCRVPLTNDMITKPPAMMLVQTVEQTPLTNEMRTKPQAMTVAQTGERTPISSFKGSAPPADNFFQWFVQSKTRQTMSHLQLWSGILTRNFRQTHQT